MEEASKALWSEEKLILGPMVRACSLPLRLASLNYGSDTVYTEEIPAWRALDCKRVENKIISTVDFVRQIEGRKEVILRTHNELERKASNCVLQLGTADASMAVKACGIFISDIAAVDLNMGCPKHYSISRGMGAELMNKPEVAEEIIKSLRRNFNIPVSVKTRIFADNDKTGIDTHTSVEWVLRLQAAGACAVTVHARTKDEKNRDYPHKSVYPLLYQSLARSNTPLVCNGDIWQYQDISELKQQLDSLCVSGREEVESREKLNCSFMVSRAALWNPSVFLNLKSHGEITELPTPAVIQKIIELSATTANCPLNTRYLLQHILGGSRMLHAPQGKREQLLRVFTLPALAGVYGCKDYVRQERSRQEALAASLDLASAADKLGGDKEASTTSLLGKRKKGKRERRWPGLVARTSHEYNDRYFDENYYIAFRRAVNDRMNEKLTVVSAENVQSKQNHIEMGGLKDTAENEKCMNG